MLMGSPVNHVNNHVILMPLTESPWSGSMEAEVLLTRVTTASADFRLRLCRLLYSIVREMAGY